METTRTLVSVGDTLVEIRTGNHRKVGPDVTVQLPAWLHVKLIRIEINLLTTATAFTSTVSRRYQTSYCFLLFHSSSYFPSCVILNALSASRFRTLRATKEVWFYYFILGYNEELYNCTLHQVRVIGVIKSSGWNGRDIWQAWWRWGMYITF
jgi:hypothetical protein